MSERFESIVFRQPAGILESEEPDFSHDLHLDEVVAAVTGGREEHDLGPFLFTALHDVDSVAYRHEVFRDLEIEGVRDAVRSFGEEMHRVRSYLGLARDQHYRSEKERWLLDAAVRYCGAVEAPAQALASSPLGSRGLRALRDFLRDHTASERFGSLAREAHDAPAGLERVRYAVRIT
jgi:hypothetical protein